MVKPENLKADKPYLVIFPEDFSPGESFRHEVDPKTAEDDNGEPK